MKRIIFTVAMLLLAVICVEAQQKGSYLTVSGSLGTNQFRYTMDNDKMGDNRLGFGAGIGYQYFFGRHWGIGTGVDIAFYNTKAHYNNSFNNDPAHYQFDGFNDGDQRPNVVKDYNLQLKLDHWYEKQYGYFIEVPLMLCYQTKWGAKQIAGMYWGVGAKAQFPIYAKYDAGGSLTVQGYYPDAKLTLDGVSGGDLSKHGFGTIKDPGYKDDIDLKISFAVTGELGFLIALNRRVDLTIGAYVDYGLNNIKDGNKSDNAYLIEPTSTAHSDVAGQNLQYNGIINSYVTDDVKLFAVGGKAGLRIKLGKLKEKEVEETKPAEMIVVQEVIKEPEPVVEVKPVIVEEPGITQADLTILSEPIFFDLGKHNLKPEAISVLDRKVLIMRQYPNTKVEILGNTCDLGGDRINIPLGQRRADAAREYLINHGIDGSRMTTKTQGSSHPIVPNTNEQNRMKNRRDDFQPSGK